MANKHVEEKLIKLSSKTEHSEEILKMVSLSNWNDIIPALQLYHPKNTIKVIK